MEQIVRKIALLGMGTVGSGVYQIIEQQKAEMPDKIGAELEIAKVLVRNKAKYADRIPAEKLTDDWQSILADESIDIVVEVMGGIEPAFTYIREALTKGKHVVTANKDLMAVHGHVLLEEAKADWYREQTRKLALENDRMEREAGAGKAEGSDGGREEKGAVWK